MKRRPIVAGILNIKADDPPYGIYSDVYGLEMNIDDEWPVDTILFVPPHHVKDATQVTEFSSMGTVYAGSVGLSTENDNPISMDELILAGCRYLLVGSAYSQAGHEAREINRQLRIGLLAGLHVVLAIDRLSGEGDADWLNEVFAGVPRKQAGDIVIALWPKPPELPPTAFQAAARQIRTRVKSLGIDPAKLRVLFWGRANLPITALYKVQPDVDGVLLPSCTFCDIMESLRGVVGAAGGLG